MCQPTRQWVSTKRCAVIARDHAFGYIFCDHGRADGEAIAECFCCGEDIGMCGRREVGVSPHLTSAGKTALDFVVDEDGADFIAAVSERLEERG